MFRCFLIIALLTLNFSVWALDLPSGMKVQGNSPVTNQSVVITILDRFTSTPGEDKTIFLKRVGRYMLDYSAQKKVETCASIWDLPAQAGWVLQVTTTSAHTTCEVIIQSPTNEVGLAKEDASIHSHPLFHDFVANGVDERAAGITAGKHEVVFNATFSEDDKAAGPGYLIANRHLQYQGGNGKDYQDFGPVSE